MRYFPDVSKWQGDINFDVMRTKTDYIIFKASQGNYADPKRIRNVTESSRVGLPFGFYHFYDDRHSPSVQAEVFAANSKGGVELWCDWEVTYGGQYKSLRDVVAFMQRVEELTGKHVGVYTGYYWFTGNSNAITNASQYKYLADRPLWLAWYTLDHTPTNIERVRIPKPWVSMDVWQYGTPAIGYEMGAQSREIDMNERVSLPSYSSTIQCKYGSTIVEYKKV
jgi:GH25 family lysozyme M1 (1,4-beta-N-acetylmuramidase)